MEEQKNMQSEDQTASEASQSQEMPQAQENVQSESQPVASEESQTAPRAEQPAQQEGTGATDNGKIWGILGYIIPIIFFIPLVMDDLKSNPYSKFHAGQQLNLLILGIVGWVIMLVLSGILVFTVVLIPLIPILWLIFQVIVVILAIMGIINAAKGEQKKLPLIGKFKLIK